jgi:hypothetical protein
MLRGSALSSIFTGKSSSLKWLTSYVERKIDETVETDTFHTGTEFRLKFQPGVATSVTSICNSLIQKQTVATLAHNVAWKCPRSVGHNIKSGQGEYSSTSPACEIVS